MKHDPFVAARSFIAKGAPDPVGAPLRVVDSVDYVYDIYAAASLVAIAVGQGKSTFKEKDYAKAAHRLARAMIEERNQTKPHRPK